MAGNPSITIIVPSLNQGCYLDQCLDSIVSQQYPNLQLLVVDGGSSDGSVDTIKKYRKYIDWWVSEPDSGQSEAINKGLARARGEVINWLNSDDYYEPGALHIVGEAFRDPAVRVLCGRSRIFDENGTIRYSRGTDIYPGNLAKTIGMARIDQPETFFRRSAFEKAGYLNTELHFLMDREFWIRYLILFGIEEISRTDSILVNFRYHLYSKTVAKHESFLTEGFFLYYDLAKSYTLNNSIATFRELGMQDSTRTTIFFPMNQNLNINFIFDYLFLYLSDFFYDKFEIAKSKIAIAAVNFDALSGKELFKAHLLKFRIKYLPKWLRRIYHSLKW